MINPRRNRLFQLALFASVAIYSLIYTNPNLLYEAFSQSMPVVFEVLAAEPPDVVSHFNLRLVFVNGQEVDELLFVDEESWLVEGGRLKEVKSLMNQLGGAFFEEDFAMVKEFQTQLEAIVFEGVDSAEYALVFLNADPVEKYGNDLQSSEDFLTTFRFFRADMLR